MADASAASAGVGAVSNLLTTWMQMQAAKEAQARQYAIDKERAAQEQLKQAHMQQIGLAGQAGNSEREAINNLLAALSRAQR